MLIGASRYSDAALPDVPAAANSLRAAERLLLEVGGWHPEQVTVLGDGIGVVEVVKCLHARAREAKDAFLLYYVGHGVISGTVDNMAESCSLGLHEGTAGKWGRGMVLTRDQLLVIRQSTGRWHR